MGLKEVHQYVHCTYVVCNMGLREVHIYVHTIHVIWDKRRWIDMYIYGMYYGIKGGTEICTYNLCTMG